MVRPRKLVFGTVVGCRSEMKAIDFGVNQCIFKVKSHQNVGFSIFAHSSRIPIDIKFVLF